MENVTTIDLPLERTSTAARAWCDSRSCLLAFQCDGERSEWKRYLSNTGFVVVHVDSDTPLLDAVLACRPPFCIADTTSATRHEISEFATCGTRALVLGPGGRASMAAEYLAAGALDYIGRPCAPAEARARLERVVADILGSRAPEPKTVAHDTLTYRRRVPHSEPAMESLRCGPVVIDVERHDVLVEGLPVRLTPTEFRLLRHLAEEPELVHRSARMNRMILGAHELGSSARTHINAIRRKLGDAGAWIIDTVRGVGYRIHPNARPPRRSAARARVAVSAANAYTASYPKA